MRKIEINGLRKVADIDSSLIGASSAYRSKDLNLQRLLILTKGSFVAIGLVTQNATYELKICTFGEHNYIYIRVACSAWVVFWLPYSLVCCSSVKTSQIQILATAN